MNTEEHVKKLLFFLEQNQIAEALDYLETLTQEERTCWEIENLTGVICSYCGQYAEAISFFRRALGHDIIVPEVYYNLADAYCGLKKYQQAILMLQHCEFVATEASLLQAVQEMKNQISEIVAAESKESEENNVLMVAYYFPPLSGSGVFRSLKFAKYLPEYGWNPTVISAKEPPKGWDYRDDSMVSEIPEKTSVIRLEDKVCTGQPVELSNERVSSLIHFLKGVFQLDKEGMQIFTSFLSSKKEILNMMTFPCGCLNWAWDVVKYIEENLDISKFKVIFTTSGPASAHLVGFYLKQKYGIPWVADYRDPWALNPYGYMDMSDPRQRLAFLLEKVLLKHANNNIVLEGSLPERYINTFGIEKDQISCITNGYDEADFQKLDYSKVKTDKFTLTYSGLLYTAQRSMLPVLRALQSLICEKKIDKDKLRLRIVGQGKEEESKIIAEKYGLSENLEQTGYVSHKEALQANIESDILLLFVGDDPRFKMTHTGKLFDYLRSGKYILALAPKDGVVDEILSSTRHGIALLSTQEAEIKDAILSEYQNWLEAKEGKSLSSSLIKEFDRRYLTMKLADILYLAEKKQVEIKETSNDVYNEGYLSGGSR